jgi:hypothetical protein
MPRSLRETALPRPSVRARDILKAIAVSQRAIKGRPTTLDSLFEKESEEHE